MNYFIFNSFDCSSGIMVYGIPVLPSALVCTFSQFGLLGIFKVLVLVVGDSGLFGFKALVYLKHFLLRKKKRKIEKRV